MVLAKEVATKQDLAIDIRLTSKTVIKLVYELYWAIYETHRVFKVIFPNKLWLITTSRLFIWMHVG